MAGEPFNAPIGKLSFGFAVCPDGAVAIGGGWVAGFMAPGCAIRLSRQEPDNPRRWTMGIECLDDNPGSGATNVTPYAICLS